MSDDAITQFIKDPLTGAEDVLSQWRERLIYYLLRGGAVFGFFALMGLYWLIQRRRR